MAGQNRFNGRGQGLPGPSTVIRNDRSATTPRSGYNPTLTNNDNQPNIRYGGMQTYETPIRGWSGDNVVGASAQIAIPIPDRTVTARFISVVGTVQVSVNGGGFRTVLNGDTFTNTEIDSMYVITGAASGCIVQTGNM
jgi:hypothetical protein